MLRITADGKSDIGKVRQSNQDAFVFDADHHLYVVADGMGGAAAGELASEMATQVIYEHLLTNWLADPDATPQRFAFRLREAVETANRHIHEHARSHPEVRGMGTTATAVGVLGDQLYLTQVGDSRAYLIRRNRAHQLTKDQSLMQRLVEAGELTEEEAAQSERRNIILQALGPDAKVKVDLTHQDVRKGDLLVLCSDGLSGQVKKEEIAAIASETQDLVEACDRLISLANERGGPDNITVIVARFDGEALRQSKADEAVGHQVYPLIDTETSTEPVPVYKGSPPPVPSRRSRSQGRVLVGALVLVAAAAVALALLRHS